MKQINNAYMVGTTAGAQCTNAPADMAWAWAVKLKNGRRRGTRNSRTEKELLKITTQKEKGGSLASVHEIDGI